MPSVHKKAGCTTDRYKELLIHGEEDARQRDSVPKNPRTSSTNET